MSSGTLEGLTQPLDLLTDRDRARAAELTGAMAALFTVEQSAFSIVHHDITEGVPKFTVVYAATSGIDVGGNWNRLQGSSSRRSFSITVGERNIDTREGMTKSVYDAMIAQVQDRATVLPDRPYVEDGIARQSSTWLTGEPDDPRRGSYGPIGKFDAEAGRTEGWEIGSWYSDSDFRFRPAVALR